MPPKKSQSVGLPRRQQKTTSSGNQLKANDEDTEIPIDTGTNSNRSGVTRRLTTSASGSGRISLEPSSVAVVLKSASKRGNPDTTNQGNDDTLQLTNRSALDTDRREPATGETLKKKTKVITQSSKLAITGGSDDILKGSGDASLSRSKRLLKEVIDAPTEETSTAATLKTSKSALMGRRRQGSSNFGLSFGADNSHRHSKRLSLDVRKLQRERNTSLTDASGDSSAEVLLGRNWRTFRVSPLYGFSRTPRALKQYSRELRTYLTATRAALPDAASVRYTTTFTMLPNLRWDDDRPEGLQIEVHSLLEGRKPITLYSGILLSWGKEMPHSTEGKCLLPLLLCTGVWRTAINVHTVLCRLFDTVIQPMEHSQSNLEWISVISMESGKPPKDKPLVMDYVDGTRKVVSFSVSALRVHNLWCNIHNENNHMVSKEEVEKFSSLLERLGSTTLCVELNRLVLARIDFPNVTLMRDGHLKIRNIESVDLILRYFCSEAILRDAYFEGYDLSETDSG